MAMTSSRPYMVRAIYEWIVDNDCTPYILVDAMSDGVRVPQQHVQNGQIVLNISPTAVASLVIGNDWIEFSGRFAGVAEQILVPQQAVLGIYAKENGQGMLFEKEDGPAPEPPEGDGSSSPDQEPPKGRPSLKVVK